MAAIDQAYMGVYSRDPGAYKATHCGTAAGTQIIVNQPAFFSHIQINQRTSSGTIVVYDAGTANLGTGLLGTAGGVIANIILGTQTFSDPIPFVFKAATNNALSVCWSGNIDFTVLALP